MFIIAVFTHSSSPTVVINVGGGVSVCVCVCVCVCCVAVFSLQGLHGPDKPILLPQIPFVPRMRMRMKMGTGWRWAQRGWGQRCSWWWRRMVMESHIILEWNMARCNVIQDPGVIISVATMSTFVFTLVVLISLLSTPPLFYFLRIMLTSVPSTLTSPPPLILF